MKSIGVEMGNGSGLLMLLGLAAALSFFAVWATHWWIKSWRDRNERRPQIVLGVAGILLPIVGMIHGYAIWVGGSALGGFALAAVALVLLQVGGLWMR
jgi:hypothetical protein